MNRDPALERRLLEAIARDALGRFGLDPSEYPVAVERRLELARRATRRLQDGR